NASEGRAEATPADGGATGDTVGIGASVAIDVAINETRAAIENGATLDGAGSVEVFASGAHAAEVSAEAGAEGGIGLTPVVAVAVADNTTSALLGTGAKLATSGNVSITAIHSGSTTSSA